MKKQISMALWSDELSEISTNKKKFLEVMERVVPWGEWTRMVQDVYPEGKRGNKPFEIELMLRIFVLQNCYDLADMKAMDEVADSRAFSLFCKVESSNQIPNGDTIGRFRNLLERNSLQTKFFEHILFNLEKQNLILKKGTIIDSTIINAPTSTKNKERKQDSEAGSTMKGKNWRFGYKAHIGVDADTKIVHSLEVTAANVHDVTMSAKLLHGKEKRVYGDAGYLGIKNRVSNKKIKFSINRRPSQFSKNTPKSRAQIKRREKEKSHIRCRVEHIFAIIKCKFLFRKSRYKGLEKQKQKINFMFTLANLWQSTKVFSST